jgi:DNA repair photolyase
LNIVAYTKGFSDREIEKILRICAESYLRQVYEFCKKPDDHFALTLKNTKGKINKLLNETRIKSHVAHLDTMTVIENYDRKFIRSKTIKDVDDATRKEIFIVRLFCSFVLLIKFVFSRLLKIMLKQFLNLKRKMITMHKIKQIIK